MVNITLDKETLSLLLLDQTTGGNIIWATDDYSALGEGYRAEKPITIDEVEVIKPRITKTQSEQLSRTKDMAETFTPSWICNKQNNLIDEAWFKRKDVFNKEDDKSWITTSDKITFPKGKSWKDYVALLRMEITCGEAPYVVSRYDTTTGDDIEIKNRIGLLDRKLRVVTENTSNREEWLEYAEESLKSIYAYEFQGDSLLLARENIYLTILDYYSSLFSEPIEEDIKKRFLNIISWNIWQMDGLKFVVPLSCHETVSYGGSLFDEDVEKLPCPGCTKDDPYLHNGIYSKIKDWQTNETIKALSLLRGL